MVGLEGTLHRHVDVISLLLAQLGELGADAIEVPLGANLNYLRALIKLFQQSDNNDEQQDARCMQ